MGSNAELTMYQQQEEIERLKKENKAHLDALRYQGSHRVRELKKIERLKCDIKGIKLFLSTIVFSGKRCGVGECSIAIHEDNIYRVKGMVDQALSEVENEE